MRTNSDLERQMNQTKENAMRDIMITPVTTADRDRAEDLRILLDQAILDNNEPARMRHLRELVTLTGGDPNKMDLTAMPTNSPEDVGGFSEALLRTSLTAAAALLLCAWMSHLMPITAEVAAGARQALGAVTKANTLGEVRYELTPYEAERRERSDLWRSSLEVS